MMPARSYEIRIRGRIPPDELEEFEGLRSTVAGGLEITRVIRVDP